MRKYYPFKCMRNFSLFVIPEIDPRKINDFEHIVEEIKNYMNTNLSHEHLDKMIIDNCKLAQNPFIAHMPIAIKNMVVKYIDNTMSSSQFTSVISNLGPVKLPEDVHSMYSILILFWTIA